MSKWDVPPLPGHAALTNARNPTATCCSSTAPSMSDQEICRHNTFAENVVFDNGSAAVGKTRSPGGYPYGRPGAVGRPGRRGTSTAHNYYGSSPGLGAKVAEKGAADLAAWQKASGLDVGSKWVNPWDMAKMPKWYQQKMAALQRGPVPAVQTRSWT